MNDLIVVEASAVEAVAKIITKEPAAIRTERIRPNLSRSHRFLWRPLAHVPRLARKLGILETRVELLGRQLRSTAQPESSSHTTTTAYLTFRYGLGSTWDDVHTVCRGPGL